MAKPDALRAALLRQQQSTAAQPIKHLTPSSQPSALQQHTGKRSSDHRPSEQHTHKRKKHAQAPPAADKSRSNLIQPHNKDLRPQPNAQSAATKQQQPSASKATGLHQQLSGARFRFLNEQLYTILSDEAYALMQDNPQLFSEYHHGYRIQVEQWPSNPLDGYIQRIQNSKRKLIVGDFGCGEARLAAECTPSSSFKKQRTSEQTIIEDNEQPRTKPMIQHTIHSFDLVASPTSLSPVTACNIAHTPLPDSTLDIAVFCLSLMGVDFIDFLREAHRVLKKSNSQLWIAEVKSRFPLLNKRGEISTDEFVDTVESIGFKLKRTNADNKMFIAFDFTKLEGPAAPGKRLKKHKAMRPASTGADKQPLLKPCLYKKR